MFIQPSKQLPISLGVPGKREVRAQFASLVYRIKGGKVQVLVITSRGTGRWIIPKGWPMHGIRPTEAAAQEAWEEAGAIGKPHDQCLGIYSYTKKRPKMGKLPVLVMVYPLKLKRLAMNFPEAGQRKRRWCSIKKAAKLVKEPELAQIISSFDPLTDKKDLKI